MSATGFVSEPEGFSISELCSLLGVTPSAIRKYEQMTELPVRRYENGYRYFYLNDLQSLLHMRALEQLGYSVREAGGIAIDADYTAKLDAGRRHIEASREALRLRQLRLEYEIELQERLTRLETEDGTFRETTRPAMWWMTCAREFILGDPASIRPWAQCIPFAEPGVRIHEGAFETGFCVRERWAGVLNESMKERAAYCPAAPCVQTVLHADKESDETALDAEIGAYFDAHGLVPEGDDFALLLASSLRTPWRPERAYDYYISWTGYKRK